jgi:hypothetical protein
MCKPIDEPLQCRTTPSIRKKRVRFGSGNNNNNNNNNIIEFERVSDPDERYSVWYNRQDFQNIRHEIGQVIQARASRDWRLKDDDVYCFRGLEFLKLDANTPSRKELRICFVKNVLLFQCMSSLSDDIEDDNDNDDGRDLALGAYCAKLSQGAKVRALWLASLDDAEARQVYHECRLLYQVNGKEMRMFAPTCSLQAAARSTMVKQQHQQRHEQDFVTGSSSLATELLPGYALSRFLRNVMNTSTSLFAASVK